MSAPLPVFRIAALYRFLPVADPHAVRETLLAAGEELSVCGTLILAEEGINGTVAASPDALDVFLTRTKELLGTAELPCKFSESDIQPFARFKIKVKPEIVTLRADGIDPTQETGTYVDPENWNELVQDPDVLVIDTRNSFEFGMGHFRGAVDPGTKSFVEFSAYAAEELDPAKYTKVAMYCTGGIRCEKASALLLQKGFKDVFQLDGGILNYLEKVPEAQSTWRGDCFVFDERVAVDHQLRPVKGKYPENKGYGKTE